MWHIASPMTRREVAFTLIGLGLGLLLSLAVVLEILVSLRSSASTFFIVGSGLPIVALVLPILLLLAGIVILARKPDGQSF